MKLQTHKLDEHFTEEIKRINCRIIVCSFQPVLAFLNAIAWRWITRESAFTEERIQLGMAEIPASEYISDGIYQAIRNFHVSCTGCS